MANITQSDMVKYVNTSVDTWGSLLLSVLEILSEETDQINGEIIPDNFVNKLQYLEETKLKIKNKIQQFADMPEDTTFRHYPDYIGGGAGGDDSQHMFIFNIAGLDRNSIPYDISMDILDMTLVSTTGVDHDDITRTVSTEEV